MDEKSLIASSAGANYSLPIVDVSPVHREEWQ
jgi:hypothetical protein